MDKITIQNARFACSVGILDAEKLHSQEIEADIELYLSTEKAGRSDDIHNSVDYVKIHDALDTVVNKRHYNLIESLAESIADEILGRFSIDRIMVRIRKRGALAAKNADFASVEIIRPLS